MISQSTTSVLHTKDLSCFTIFVFQEVHFVHVDKDEEKFQHANFLRKTVTWAQRGHFSGSGVGFGMSLSDCQCEECREWLNEELRNIDVPVFQKSPNTHSHHHFLVKQNLSSL